MEGRVVHQPLEDENPRPVLEREPYQEQDGAEAELPPSELVLRGLTRAHGLILYRELDKSLNPLTNQSTEVVEIAKMDEAALASIERPPIYLRTDIDTDYDISLEENEPGAGRFDLEIKRGKKGEEEYIASRAIHGYFQALMQSLDLRAASGLISGMALEDPESLAFEKVAPRRLKAENRMRNLRRAVAPRKEPEYANQLTEIYFLGNMLNLVDIEQVSSESLMDFWKDREFNHLNVVELFLFVVNRKQEIREAPGTHYNQYFERDMVAYAGKYRAEVVRKKMERATTHTMQTKFGMLPHRAAFVYGSIRTPLDRLRLEYLSWLAGYPDLDISRFARQAFRRPINSHDDLVTITRNIYGYALKHLEREIDTHRGKVGEVWETFEDIEYERDYDKTIPNELEAYNQKMRFLNVAWMLGKYLFTTEKLDEALEKRLQ